MKNRATSISAEAPKSADSRISRLSLACRKLVKSTQGGAISPLPADTAPRSLAPHNSEASAGLWAFDIKSAGDPGDERRVHKSRAHFRVSSTCEGWGFGLTQDPGICCTHVLEPPMSYELG